MAKNEKAAPNRARDASSSEGAEIAAEWVDIDRLKAWDKNPRKNDGEPVDKVAASIKRLGFGAPIVARMNGEIIAGHTRWKASKKLGLKRVPVRFVDLDPADASLMALADNRLNEAAEWDVPLLGELLSEHSFDDVEIAGWSQKDLENMASNVLGDASDIDGAEDDTSKLDGSFAVVVECEDEQEQIHIIEECERKGWKCRALT